jgi:hypothetical protein
MMQSGLWRKDGTVKVRKVRPFSILGGLRVGCYVFVSRWSDSSPYDPWAVGVVDSIILTSSGNYIKIDGYARHWQNFRIIEGTDGIEIIKRMKGEQ